MHTFYIIKNALNHFKLGITTRDVKLRVKQFETGNSDELEIIKTFNTKHGTIFESTMHRRFVNKRLKGEWFKLDEKDILNIDDILTETEKNLDIVSDMLHKKKTNSL